MTTAGRNPSPPPLPPSPHPIVRHTESALPHRAEERYLPQELRTSRVAPARAPCVSPEPPEIVAVGVAGPSPVYKASKQASKVLSRVGFELKPEYDDQPKPWYLKCE